MPQRTHRPHVPAQRRPTVAERRALAEHVAVTSYVITTGKPSGWEAACSCGASAGSTLYPTRDAAVTAHAQHRAARTRLLLATSR